MRHENRHSQIEPMPVALLREPLVWFFAEHYRHRDVCQRLLDMSVSVAFDEAQFEDILYFLECDLPLHIIDEEDDLFPLLRRRCDFDDHIEAVLGRLAGEHASDMHDATALIELLVKAMDDQRGLAGYANTRMIVRPFCASQKRHIALENAVVLPIARLRLTEEDLCGLGRRLAARRGLPNPFLMAS